jgi:dihydrofolate synthase / folylpolyglutamate synthase
MRSLVRELGHPERSFKSILIAGTNGKGSVSAYLDGALRSAPLVVGRYTSPHLIDIRERMTVSGKNIGKADFERLVLEVRDAAERLVRRGVLSAHPNHFEILTAVAFLFFKEKRIDIAVLEVGLGGRLDATNVSSPLVSTIVSIDFDHEELLGSTLASIAEEKAGVVRRARPVILGPMAPEAGATIVRAARRLNATAVAAFSGVRVRSARGGLDIRTPGGRYAGVTPLPGAHQRINLVVAIRSLEALSRAGIEIDLGRAVDAMSRVRWPGRLERFAGRPPFLLDGAHNPAGAKALAAYIREEGPSHLLVFGAMRDKHVKEMAAELFPLARRIIATRMKRAATTGDLAEIGRALGVMVQEESSIHRAISLARRAARPGETVVVAGSLYLVGAVRRLLVKQSGGR